MVERALESLTKSVNLANGMLTAPDAERTDETLSILRAKGHVLDPAAIRSWAIRAGWRLKAADELMRKAERMHKRTTKPTLARINNAQARYDRWT